MRGKPQRARHYSGSQNITKSYRGGSSWNYIAAGKNLRALPLPCKGCGKTISKPPCWWHKGSKTVMHYICNKRQVDARNARRGRK